MTSAVRSKSPDDLALLVTNELIECCRRGEERIAAFINYNRQVEGWFKGELLTIGMRLEKTGQILALKPDERIDRTLGKHNVDLCFITSKDARVWIELKHWYLGKYSSGARWNATAYFTQRTSGTPNNFVNKLSSNWRELTYMLLVTTPRPDLEDWSRGLARFRAQHPNRKIRDLTNPKDFPTKYYVGLISV